MAKFRFIAPEPRIVPWLGPHAVQPDEIVTVPDAQAASYACQPQVWEVVEEPKGAAPKKTTTSSSGKSGGTSARKDGE